MIRIECRREKQCNQDNQSALHTRGVLFINQAKEAPRDHDTILRLYHKPEPD